MWLVVSLLSSFAPILLLFAIITCNSDRAREQSHVGKRQALKKKQREAMLSRVEVNTVLDDLDNCQAKSRTPCSRVSCVRVMPVVPTTASSEIYRRLDAVRPTETPPTKTVTKNSTLTLSTTQDSTKTTSEEFIRIKMGDDF